MAKLAKKSKKPVRKNSKRRKEVEIPVFVISKKEKAVSSAPRKKATLKKEEEELGILKDKDNLPVFQNFSTPPKEDENQEKIRKEGDNLKNATHKKVTEVVEEKRSRKKVSLPESKRIIIMWASVAVLACLIFFVWFSGLKNNFSDFFGSTSFTFSRQAGAMEEVSGNLEESVNQADFLEETEESADIIGENKTDVLDKIKEKILVEELKNKLE